MQWQLRYDEIKYICMQFERNIDRLDVLYYNGSNLQTMFNNLHNKIIATLNKVINDIDNNRLDNDRILPPNLSFQYARLLEKTDPKWIKTLFNDFNRMHEQCQFIHLKDFLTNCRDKLQTVKELTDRKITKQINEYHVLPYYTIDHNIDTDMLINIDVYMLIMNSLLDSMSHVKSKQLVQCSDFLDAFGSHYNYMYSPYCNTWNYILKYDPTQSPEKILKRVLLNNNDSFDLDNNNVENVPMEIIHNDYADDDGDYVVDSEPNEYAIFFDFNEY